MTANLAENLVGNSVLAGALLFIVKWLLAHFDKREASRDLERLAFLTELKAIGSAMSEIVRHQHETTRSLRDLHREIIKCTEKK